ncbi:Ventral anterior homeobox 1 [Aphelenchoides avenae]|nr:Ventral anterior homeobox 1 [Aphelenchus avenae]
MDDISFQSLNGDASLHALNGELSPPAKSRKRRTVFNAEQVQILEDVFQRTQFVTGEEKTRLAQHLNVTEFTIKIWFQNRRAKEKKTPGGDGGSMSGDGFEMISENFNVKEEYGSAVSEDSVGADNDSASRNGISNAHLESLLAAANQAHGGSEQPSSAVAPCKEEQASSSPPLQKSVARERKVIAEREPDDPGSRSTISLALSSMLNNTKPCTMWTPTTSMALSDICVTAGFGNSVQPSTPTSSLPTPDFASLLRCQNSQWPVTNGLPSLSSLTAPVQSQTSARKRRADDPVALPKPIPTRATATPISDEDDVVDTQGRAFTKRMQKIYRQDTKAYLELQNEVNSVIFKYEMKLL